MDPRLRDGLLQIYDDVARDIAALAPVCEISGRCCRFREYGHRLYMTRPEAELLLSEGLPPNSTVNEESCPFQIQGLCTAREKRPFGCRVYFCDQNYVGAAERLTEQYLARLKHLHRDTQTLWEYAELVTYLREYEVKQDHVYESQPSALVSDADPDSVPS